MRLRLLLLLSIAANSFATTHLPLDLDFNEYHSLYAKLRQDKSIVIKDANIRKAIDGGEKMANWIKLINSNRVVDQAIRLTSKETQRGIPIDKPSKYGPSTIKVTLNELKRTMPLELRDVIFGKMSISKSPLVTDEVYIKWCRKVSALYQSAVRWTSMQKWLSQYAKKKYKDIRGFYYLKNLADLDQNLRNPSQLTSDELTKLKQALIGICINSVITKKKCTKLLERSLTNNKLLAFKNKYWSQSKLTWDSFFKIRNPRNDVEWKKSAPGVMEISFKDPGNSEVADWLKENVEDEFKLPQQSWIMELRYTKGGWDTAYLQFKKNVTPHVSGGNKIVMDANTPLQEYNVRWTIRHEFGHILRIPDCYHEFYDKEQNLMINYQLDTSDLMCSRKGAMNSRIYEELKRVYLK